MCVTFILAGMVYGLCPGFPTRRKEFESLYPLIFGDVVKLGSRGCCIPEFPGQVRTSPPLVLERRTEARRDKLGETSTFATAR
jgi:hypothetical protein